VKALGCSVHTALGLKIGLEWIRVL
jgi:hypothetical protein